MFRGFASSVDADYERANLEPAELEREEEAQVEAATMAAFAKQSKPAAERLLEQMADVAKSARGKPDPKVTRLIEWVREHMLKGKEWTDTRVPIFTEDEATLMYLREQLDSVIAPTD